MRKDDKKSFWEWCVEKLNAPPRWVLALVYTSTLILFGISTLAMTMGEGTHLVAFIIYTLTILGLLYSIYTIVHFIYVIRGKALNAAGRYAFTRNLRDNYDFRTLFFSAFSLVGNVWYSLFLLKLAFRAGTLWYWALAIYYILLTTTRGGVLMWNKKAERKYGSESKQTQISRLRGYRYCGVMLLVLTAILAGAIVQMVVKGERFPSSSVTIYAFTLVATYRIATAVYHFIRVKYSNDFTVRAVQNVNFSTAFVAVLTLQTAILDTFVKGGRVDVWNGITGALVCLSILALGVYMIVYAEIKLRKIEVEKEKINNGDELEKEQI